MDQTSIPYSYHSFCIIEKKGENTIHICESTTDTKHATLAAMVMAIGKLLNPMHIFMGQAGRWIETREIQMYPDECVYAHQQKH
jgi:hypothetical protein